MPRRAFACLIACLLLLASSAFAAPVEVSVALSNSLESLPVYPHAAPRNEAAVDDSRMKSVSVDGPLRGSLSAATYVSKDSAAKILGFYRSALREYGSVVECSGGINPEVNVRINMRNFGTSDCNPEDIGSGATELRVGDAREQHIVTVRTTDNGSEFTLVSVFRRPKKPNFF